MPERLLLEENAGNTNQGIKNGGDPGNLFSVAVGTGAGQTNQEEGAIAIGHNSNKNQGTCAIAIGYAAGEAIPGVGQQQNAIAIGQAAGAGNQGEASIAIGRLSGQTNQGIDEGALVEIQLLLETKLEILIKNRSV